MKPHTLKRTVRNTWLGRAMLATLPALCLNAQMAPDTRLEKLEQENSALKKRLDALEDLAIKEGLVAKQGEAPGYAKVLGDLKMSGFVTASYFFDTSDPEGGVSPGYLWNRNNGSISINKIKLTLASDPVERSGDVFDYAYRVSLIFGEDAPIVNSGSAIVGFENLREAYFEMNVPVGTGLNVKIGELISLLNYESGDGGAANNNFSQGYQWFFTGNGPATGVQLGYSLSDKVDVKFRVQNGLYAGPIDANINKTMLASIGIKPTDKLWFSLVGFSGREGPTGVRGGSLLGGWQATEKLSFGTELDYFDFDTAGAGGSPVWSTGLWLAYDFTEKLGVALRSEFLSDIDGTGTGGLLAFAPNPGQDLFSTALTLNIKPYPYIKIQPEIRYDNSTLTGAFGRQRDRVFIGAGVSYLF